MNVFFSVDIVVIFSFNCECRDPVVYLFILIAVEVFDEVERMPSKNAWPVPRRRRVVVVRIQKWWFYGIKRRTLVLLLLVYSSFRPSRPSSGGNLQSLAES